MKPLPTKSSREKDPCTGNKTQMQASREPRNSYAATEHLWWYFSPTHNLENAFTFYFFVSVR